jgi:hypothetical protein
MVTSAGSREQIEFSVAQEHRNSRQMQAKAAELIFIAPRFEAKAHFLFVQREFACASIV